MVVTQARLGIRLERFSMPKKELEYVPGAVTRRVLFWDVEAHLMCIIRITTKITTHLRT